MGIPSPLGVGASGLPPQGDKANAVLSGVLSAIGPSQPFAFLGQFNVTIWGSVNAHLTVTAGSLSGSVNSATGLAVGNAINSVLAPEGSTIKTLSGTTVGLGVPPQTYQGQVVAGYPQISGLPVTNGLLGSTVSGAGIPSATTVTAILQAAVLPTDLSPGTPGVVMLSANVTSAPQAPMFQPFTFAVTGNAVLVSGTDNAALFTGAAIDWTGTVQLERSFDGGATFIVDSLNNTGTIAQWTTGTPVSTTFYEPELQVLYRLNCLAVTGSINFRLSQTGGATQTLSGLI